MAATREKEAVDLLPLCDDAPPPRPGQWTVKDHLAHMAAWRDHAAEVLNAARRGEAPAGGTGIGEQNAALIDEQNTAIFEATRDLPASSVLDSVRASWESLAAAIESSSETDLLAPLPDDPQRAAWEVVPGNTHGHLGEHLEYLATARGDETAAEAAARWVHDLQRQAFADDGKRTANAAYNLGCFYARRARVDEALAHFAPAFELDPTLREFARKDPDLDPIRSAPQAVELLR